MISFVLLPAPSTGVLAQPASARAFASVSVRPSAGSASSTGTSLSLIVSWSAYDRGDGNTLISVSGDISSYSLSLGTLYSAASIDLAGYGVTCDTNSVYVAQDAGNVTNHLFSTSFTVPTGTEGTMTVSWRFGGSYAGVELPYITASGYVSTG